MVNVIVNSIKDKTRDAAGKIRSKIKSTAAGKKACSAMEKLNAVTAKPRRVLSAFYGKICEKTAKPVAFIRKCEQKPLLFCIGLSFLLYLVVEMLSRRSVFAAVTYLIHNPAVFIYNWLIVLVTLSIALLFKRREFMFALISIAWFVLGTVNCVLLGYRTTPLNFMDFGTFKDVMGIMTVYFSPSEIVSMAVIAGLVILVICFLFIKSPKEKIRLPKAAASIAALSVTLALATSVSVSSGSLATTFHNIQDAYKQYGFAYCFACSVVDRGISKPEGYSEEMIGGILEKIEENKAKADKGAEPEFSNRASEKTPNIVMLQMESFFDVNHLKGVTFSENPLPVYTSLKENYSSGYLTTPSFGAGTSNTEFEVLTGMSLDYFGPGEYPYTTILRETTGESVAYDLKDYGYSSHAIHNHTGKFYGRYLVYPNLGFDSFTSVEYMQNVERNPLDWADDSCLTGEIMKAMNDTENQDLVFAVSVQGHGKYPTEVIDETQTIKAYGFNEAEAVGFDYYINQINDMDAFLGELTDELSKSDEPTVLVIYGDHLPKFTIDPSELENGNIYQTEYVIWDNFGLAKEDADLNTYQLYPQVLSKLNMTNGVMTGFQQFCKGDESFYNMLGALQYDILYGQRYAYGGSNPFEKADMHMGIDPISISGISVSGDYLYISGKNFTTASKIFINGNELKTTFLNSERIMCTEGASLDEGDMIQVIQMSSKKTQLSSTEQWVWYPDGAVVMSESDANHAFERVESQDDIERDISREENEI